MSLLCIYLRMYVGIIVLQCHSTIDAKLTNNLLDFLYQRCFCNYHEGISVGYCTNTGICALGDLSNNQKPEVIIVPFRRSLKSADACTRAITNLNYGLMRVCSLRATITNGDFLIELVCA